MKGSSLLVRFICPAKVHSCAENAHQKGVAAGGQLTTTTEVENFPGFPKGITGSEMMDLFKEQSTRFGTEVITETIHRVDLSSRPFKLWTEDEQSNEKPSLLAESVVLATGATAKRLFIKGEDFYWNRGISACAVCDGAIPIFRNKPLAVVGGGDSACEEATFLTRYGSKVYLLVRKDKLRASKVMADRVLANPKIEVMWHTSAIEAHGDGKLLTSLTIEGTDGPKKGQHWPLEVNGLFYAIGHEPNSKFLLNKAGDEKHAKNPIEVDADGYVKVQPGTTLTNIEGVFACGDLQDKRYRQAITAAGSGCMAALDCERWSSFFFFLEAMMTQLACRLEAQGE